MFLRGTTSMRFFRKLCVMTLCFFACDYAWYAINILLAELLLILSAVVLVVAVLPFMFFTGIVGAPLALVFYILGQLGELVGLYGKLVPIVLAGLYCAREFYLRRHRSKLILPDEYMLGRKRRRPKLIKME